MDETCTRMQDEKLVMDAKLKSGRRDLPVFHHTVGENG